MDSRLLEKYDRLVPRYTSYPTAPHFDGSVGADSYAAWLSDLPDGMPLSVYVHIPFCDTLCWFCGCHTKLVNRYEPVTAYLRLLEREIGLVRDRIGIGHAVRHMHWGGGSPTILHPNDILRLGGALAAALPMASDAEFAVEIDPRELPPAAIDALAEIGVNRASIGVQDIDETVQRAVNRVQPMAMTVAAAVGLRRAGIRAINLDLMYGLPHQTIDRVRATADFAIDLEPDRIALFGYAHVPEMKRHQRLIDAAALPDGTARLAQAEAVAERLVAAGYVPIGLDHFARPDDPLARAAAAGRLRRNFQGYTTDDSAALIGLGASAIGRLPQGYVQNAVPLHAYRDAMKAGRLATVRGRPIGAEDRLRGAVIERLMCNLRVDPARLCAEHGADPDTFAPEMAVLEDFVRDGVLDRTGGAITVREEARPLVRCVAAVFDGYLRQGETRHSRAV
ncbi:MAG: oxygen-independent coproporphyrinogen III oxidase [Inquilinus sp.]|nr:oxygen-independent coproporphyrinogen III oxidase [Inquilinus sp.]